MRPSKHESVRPKPIRALRVITSVVTDGAGNKPSCLDVGPWRFRCSIGRSGVTHSKREGDGSSPIGRFAILGWRIRPGSSVSRPGLPWRTIRSNDGWCDDPRSPLYNREIKLPSGLSHEQMWRADRKYDVVAILSYNIRPRTIGRGSAIFFHLCSDRYETTAGCVAVTANDMRKLMPRLARAAFIEIG